jgi:hypothetical protein
MSSSTEISKRISVKSAKAKGRRLQKQIVQDILSSYPNLSPSDVVSTPMGQGGEDIRMSESARQCLPISVEAKCQERLNVWKAIDQCERNSKKDLLPVLVFSKNRCNTYAVVKWSSLLSLLKRPPEGDLPQGLQNLIDSLSVFSTQNKT